MISIDVHSFLAKIGNDGQYNWHTPSGKGGLVGPLTITGEELRKHIGKIKKGIPSYEGVYTGQSPSSEDYDYLEQKGKTEDHRRYEKMVEKMDEGVKYQGGFASQGDKEGRMAQSRTVIAALSGLGPLLTTLVTNLHKTVSTWGSIREMFAAMRSTGTSEQEVSKREFATQDLQSVFSLQGQQLSAALSMLNDVRSGGSSLVTKTATFKSNNIMDAIMTTRELVEKALGAVDKWVESGEAADREECIRAESEAYSAIEELRNYMRVIVDIVGENLKLQDSVRSDNMGN